MAQLPILDPKATGIDVGSQTLHVSIGGDTPRVFGTMTCDLLALRDWLLAQGVGSVAMEATGVYWLTVYEVLVKAGLQVLVVNGRHVKSVPGRKTDMHDSQWLATLHAHGLLRSGFVPEPDVRRLQDYMRLRDDHITMAGQHAQHIHKALERMNLKFQSQLSDLMGVSGQAVVRAIVAGERDPHKLLALCDAQVRKRKGALVLESLRGYWKQEHLFAMRQALAGWDFYQARIAECDAAVAEVLEQMRGPPPGGAMPMSPARPGGENAPNIAGLHQMLLSLCGGHDPTTIPTITDYTLLRLLSEVGTDLGRWPSAKQFTAWAGLAPGSRQSGKRRGSVSRHCNRAGRIFCVIARGLARSVTKGLGAFYRRLRARRGGLVANRALARKLAAMFWQVMVHGVAYVEQGVRRYEQRVQQSEQRLVRKLARKCGLTVIQGHHEVTVPG